jgi:hypothetical protein
MEHAALMAQLGYDDTYVATENSRSMYNVLLGMEAQLGKYIGLRGSAVAVSNAHVHSQAIQDAVDLTTEVIARASYRSMMTVKRQRALARHVLGMNKKPRA